MDKDAQNRKHGRSTVEPVMQNHPDGHERPLLFLKTSFSETLLHIPCNLNKLTKDCCSLKTSLLLRF